tara:strand:+ start:364 stop:765 length:402 start_codon:yes stop_codon:yes gene_type:complete
MSTVLLNTLTGKTSAGSIVVTGEGGSTTTNMQQGLSKCWFQITQDSSHSLDDSFNVGSISDDGAGETTVNFSNAMSNSDWSGVLTAQGSNNRRAVNNAPNTTRIKVETYQVDSNTSATDATGGVSGTVHGDLA